jgi:hypothetical protein
MTRGRRCDYWTTAPYFSLECDEVRYDINKYLWSVGNELRRENPKEFYAANRESILKRCSKYNRRFRLKALAKLGGKCAWAGCGITDERILEIHHRNGDGAVERRAGIDGVTLYKKVLKDPTPYLLFCCNHHRLRTLEERKLRKRNPQPQPSHLPSVNLNEERKAS